MYRIDDVNISFSSWCIFDHACFDAKRGGLNVLAGKSGSGKSTLIDAMLFRFPCHWEVDGIDLGLLDDSGRSAFLHTGLRVVHQEPLFLDDITIEENIRFIAGKDGDQAVLSRLGVDAMLRKYPGNLSSGERSRAALAAALCAEPAMLVLDEPTAALDHEWRDVVAAVLEDYAKEHIVVCATHDTYLMDIASRLSEIRDGKIICVRDDIREENGKSSLAYELPEEHARKYVPVNWKHHPIHFVARFLLVVAAVVFLFVSGTLNNMLTDAAMSKVEQLADLEFLVYKPLYPDAPYSYIDREYPLSPQEEKRIKEMDGIARCDWRIDISDFNIMTGMYSWLMRESEKEYVFELVDGDDTYPYPVQNDQPISNLSVFPDWEEIPRLAEDFAGEGVYLSQELYAMIVSGNRLEKPILHFDAPVPVLNCFGNALYFDQNNQTHDASITVCKGLDIRVPVAGVVTKPVGIHLSVKPGLYIPLSLMKKWMEEAGEAETHVYYDIDNVLYVDDLPEDVSLQDEYGNMTMTTVNWRPSAMVIAAEDMTAYVNLIDTLRKEGYGIASTYEEASAILNVQKETKRTLMITSAVVFGFLLAAMGIAHKLGSHAVRRLYRYLYTCGYTKKQRRIFHRKRLMRMTGILGCASMAVYFAVITALLKSGVAYIKPKASTFAMIFGVAVILEYVWPWLIQRGIVDDPLR